MAGSTSGVKTQLLAKELHALYTCIAILAQHGLIGKHHLESDWSEDELFAEVRTVFKDAMADDQVSGSNGWGIKIAV